jgi:hypothetical protein
MIKQIKTYQVTCSRDIIEVVDGRERYSDCPTTIVVQGTSKYDAMRSLPEDWRWRHDDGSDVKCPREDHAW